MLVSESAHHSAPQARFHPAIRAPQPPLPRPLLERPEPAEARDAETARDALVAASVETLTSWPRIFPGI